MQISGEHAHCGPPLDPESGFTYAPQIFMDNDSEIFNTLNTQHFAHFNDVKTIKSTLVQSIPITQSDVYK